LRLLWQRQGSISDAKVPCITLRENTEWIETIEDGWNVLVGADKKEIIENVSEFAPKTKQRNVFGDGKASKRIVDIITSFTKL
jgi:UDP-N-acetylglucosamine 2-epimerase